MTTPAITPDARKTLAGIANDTPAAVHTLATRIVASMQSRIGDLGVIASVNPETKGLTLILGTFIGTTLYEVRISADAEITSFLSAPMTVRQAREARPATTDPIWAQVQADLNAPADDSAVPASISHGEAQELHRLIGGLLHHCENNLTIDRGEALPDLERALELASLVAADTADINA